MVYMMRRHLYFLFLFLTTAFLFVGCKQHRKVDVNPGPAQILFDVSEVDFGRQEEGERKLHRDVVFYNTGSEPLMIYKVETSCHCTVADVSKEPVRPGGYGEISIEFDLSGITGKFARSLTVYDNTKEGQHSLVIRGEVVSHEDDQ